VKIPDPVRGLVRERLWQAADAVDWERLSASAKATYYSHWTDDPTIGGVLGNYIAKAKVRVYLKDTVLKEYARTRAADADRPLRALRIDPDTRVVVAHTRPHGRTFEDGRVVCWGTAADWKHVLMAVHERAYGNGKLRPFGAVLVRATGRYHDANVRAMIEAAAHKLGVEQVVWLES